MKWRQQAVVVLPKEKDPLEREREAAERARLEARVQKVLLRIATIKQIRAARGN